MATHRFSVPGKKSKEMFANIPASKKLNGIEANATYFNNFRSLGTNTDTNNKNTKGIHPAWQSGAIRASNKYHQFLHLFP